MFAGLVSASAQAPQKPCTTDSVWVKKGTLLYVTVDCDSVSYEYEYAEGRLLSRNISYYTKTVRSQSERYDRVTSYVNRRFEETYYPNGVRKEASSFRYVPSGLSVKSYRDTLREFYDTGLPKVTNVYHNNKQIRLTAFARDGRVKEVWEMAPESQTVQIKKWGPDGKLQENGDFDNRGTGYLNRYEDDGTLSGKCYYKKMRLVPKKCIQIR